MAKNDFQYGGWNTYALQCGTIMTLISSGDYTLLCGMWLWNRDSEFTKWQHPALWYLVLGWHMPLNSPKRPPYWISTSDFDFDHITAVDMSFYISVRNFIQIGPPSAEKMTSCWFSRWRISAILDFRHQIMGSLRSPCTTSYRSSIETIALNCLVFEKIAFFGFLATDRHFYMASWHGQVWVTPKAPNITLIFLFFFS